MSVDFIAAKRTDMRTKVAAAAPRTPGPQHARLAQLSAMRNAPPAVAHPAVVLQRKVGFEFESANNENRWTFQGRNDGENWAMIKHTKAILVPMASGLGGLSADNGAVEMVTSPLSNWGQVTAAISGLLGMVGTYQNATKVLEGGANDAARAHTHKEQNRVVGKASFQAKPQATLGVAMENIEALFDKLLAMGKRPQSPLEQNLANVVTLNATGIAVDEGKDILSRALELYRERHDPTHVINDVAALEGFMGVVLKTLYDAWSNSGRDLTDPKYAFTIMPRTDFTSMVVSLPADARASLLDLVTSGVLFTAFDEKAKRFKLNSLVFPGGYTYTKANGKPGRSKGPTVGQWLHSIFYGADPKDLLSPPPGYPRHGVNPEGLGAHGTDRDDPTLSLFELRNLTNGEIVATDAWLPLARIVSQIASEVQNDAGLRPH